MSRELHLKRAYLNGRSVHIEFLEDSKCLFEQLVVNSNAGNIWSIVVIQTCNVLHHTSSVCLDSSQDQQVLEIPVSEMNGTVHELSWKVRLTMQNGSYHGRKGSPCFRLEAFFSF